MTRQQRLILLATIIGSGVAFLDGTVVNLALPKIAAELHADFSGLQWIMDGYLLSLSALILLGGSLGDIFGRKRMFMLGLSGFALSSLLCAIAPTIELLIAARIIQGACAALMIPESLAIIDVNFSSQLRGRAIAAWTAATSALSTLGPLLGGYVIDNGSWRWVFLISVPLLATAYWIGHQAIPESKAKPGRHVDWAGAGLAMLALGGLTYGLIEGPGRQWSLVPLAAVIMGALLAILFIWLERRKADPMVKLSLFQSRNFSGANLVTLAMYGALGGFFFVFVIYLQTALGFSSMLAGLSLLPVTVLLVLLSGKVGALSTAYGPRLFMTFGPILAGLGILWLLPLQAGADYWLVILPGIVLFGIGLSLTVAPLTTTVLSAVPAHEAGIASGVNNAVSRMAGLIVIATVGLLGAAHAYQFAAGLSASLAIGAGLLAWVLIRNDAVLESN